MSIGNADVLRVVAVSSSFWLSDILNVYYVRVTNISTQTQTEILEDCAEWLERIYAPIAAYFAASQTFERIEFFNITKDESYPAIPWPTLTTGSSGADNYAEGVAAVLFARTGIKRVIARKFIGLLTETIVLNGELAGAFLTDLATAAGYWLIAGTMSNGTTVTPGTWRRVAGTFATFLDVTIRSVVGYQRRRRRGVGR